jgi:hypothetical protein
MSGFQRDIANNSRNRAEREKDAEKAKVFLLQFTDRCVEFDSHTHTQFSHSSL